MYKYFCYEEQSYLLTTPPSPTYRCEGKKKLCCTFSFGNIELLNVQSCTNPLNNYSSRYEDPVPYAAVSASPGKAARCRWDERLLQLRH